MPREASVASGGRYRMAQHGHSSRRNLQGVYILKENAGCQLWRPTWNHTRTVFRPFPMWDPENPDRFDPFKLSQDARDTGDWIRRYDAVTGLGVPGITYILRNYNEHDMDIQQNPAWMLYRSIKSACSSGQGHPSWFPLLEGQTGRGAPLDTPTDVYLIQGILLEHKSKVLQQPAGMMADHDTCVMMLSQSAGDALLEVCNDPSCPDLIDFDNGRFIDFHQNGTQSLLAQQQAAQQTQAQAPRQLGSSMGGGGGGGGGRGGMQANYYEVDVLELYQGNGASLTHMRDALIPKIKRWDDIINIPSVEEQVHLIATSGLPANAITYALGDTYGQYIPDHVWAAARATTTQVAMGGHGGAQGGFQAPPQQGGFQAPPSGAQGGTPPTVPPASQQGGFTPPPAGAPPQGGFQAPPTGNPNAGMPVHTPTQDPGMPPLTAMPAGAPPLQSANQAQQAVSTAPAGPPAQGFAAPAAQPPTQPTAPPVTPPATQPGFQGPPAQPPAGQAAPGFDQPTHANQSTAADTQAALERARARARTASGN